MNKTKHPGRAIDGADDGPTVMGVLGDTVRQITPGSDADAAEGKDTADVASGVEVPQDGDPGR